MVGIIKHHSFAGMGNTQKLPWDIRILTIICLPQNKLGGRVSLKLKM